jgi:uncharacterized membrane protein YsdA (DUF1294 family)
MALKIIAVYLVTAQVVTLMAMLLDKWYAVKGKWRISESVLLSLAIVGGGIGLLMGMVLGHHKLSKVRFRVIGTLGSAVLLLIFTYFTFEGSLIFQ